MKGWIFATLALTFAAGISTGTLMGMKLAHRHTTEPWIDSYIQQLRHQGVTKPEDLREARQIYEKFEHRVYSLNRRVESMLKDQLRQISDETQARIQAILDRYPHWKAVKPATTDRKPK